jgi:hypothetical protein
MINRSSSAPSEHTIEKNLRRLLEGMRVWFSSDELKQVAARLAIGARERSGVISVVLARDTRLVSAADLYDRRGERLVVSSAEGALASSLLRGSPRHEAFLFVLMEHATSSRLELPGAVDFFDDLTVVGMSWDGDGSVTEYIGKAARTSQKGKGKAKDKTPGATVILPESTLRHDALLTPGLTLSELRELAGETRSSPQMKLPRSLATQVRLPLADLQVVVEVARIAAHRSQAAVSRGAAFLISVSGMVRVFAGAAYSSHSDPRFHLSPAAVALLELASFQREGVSLGGQAETECQVLCVVFSNSDAFELPHLSELEIIADQLGSAGVCPGISVSESHEIGLLTAAQWPKARWKLL